jgi:ketol-acid reductoisomerase
MKSTKKRTDRWLAGFATATAAINTSTAVTDNELIVAVMTENGITLDKIKDNAEYADYVIIKTAFDKEEKRR